MERQYFLTQIILNGSLDRLIIKSLNSQSYTKCEDLFVEIPMVFNPGVVGAYVSMKQKNKAN